MLNSKTDGKKKVCVIGGGPSGLAALRRVLESEKLTGTLFELKDDIGGVWNYQGHKFFQKSSKNDLEHTDLSEKDPEFVNTMFDNLRANVPHTLLALEDFPHTNVEDTFPTQNVMHKYFQDYATHFKLWSNIQLNTSVVSVSPENPLAVNGDHNQRWIVKTHDHKFDIDNTEVYDAIMICTGSNTYPYEPKIPGLETFIGKVMHAKYFKNAEADEFEDKNVVLIGLGPSSGDLGMFISKKAKSVTVCHKFPLGFSLGLKLPNVKEVQGVNEVTSNGVITLEDEYIKCDTIVLCTGYIIKYPFLDEECGLVVKENGKYVPHLYEMMIFTKRPTLEISAVDVQVKYFVACLEGKMQLPSYDQMEAEIKAEEEVKKQQRIQYSEWYQIGTFGLDYWDYFAKLVKRLGIEDQYKHRAMHVHLWRTVLPRIFGKYTIFRKDQINVVSDSEWEYVLSADPNEIGSIPRKMIMRLDPKDGKFSVDTIDL